MPWSKKQPPCLPFNTSSGTFETKNFGEEENVPSITLIEAAAGSPATTESIELTSARGLRTLRGTRDGLLELREHAGDDYLRIQVEEKPTPGLADEIRDTFPNAVDVVIAGDEPDVSTVERLDLKKLGAPRDLFTAYLKEREIENQDLVALFDTLVEEALETDQA